MKRILILGAGKSTGSLVQYLLGQSEKNNWYVTVGDLNLDLAEEKINDHKNGKAIVFDILDEAQRNQEIENADVVVSLLPAKFHILVARACLIFEKHLVTASYVSDDCLALHDEFAKKDLLFMGESGLDPGIDHLIMMKKLDELKDKNVQLDAVLSFTGALVTPECFIDNPWKYKFTWAPMNVVLAGQGLSQYKYDGATKYIPYNRVFQATLERKIDTLGSFDVYPNRNSIPYIKKYDLGNIPTFLRGTMRYKGYCEAWNALIRLGWTDNVERLNVKGISFKDYLKSFIPVKYMTHGDDLAAALCDFLNIEKSGEVFHKLQYLDIFSDDIIPFNQATSAEILLYILKGKWTFKESDSDLVVMLHEFDYTANGVKYKDTSSIISTGNSKNETAIAKWVGLPVGIMVKLILENKTTLRGVRIPIHKEIYNQMLPELETLGIDFIEKTEIIDSFVLQ